MVVRMDMLEQTVLSVRQKYNYETFNLFLIFNNVSFSLQSLFVLSCDHILGCEAGFYGKDCNEVCSPNCKTCRHTNGECTCVAGWMGSDCSTGKKFFSG